MKFTRTIKTALVAVIVGAFVVSGVALAQTNEAAGQDDSVVSTHISGALSPLVADGTITEAQAEAVAEALVANRPAFGRRGGHGLGPGLETAAEVLGMDVAELQDLLRDGASLADIAGDQVDDVVTAMVAEAQERLAQAVEAGRLTQDEADVRLAEAAQRITDHLNGVQPEGRPGPGQGVPGQRGPGRGGPGFGAGAGQGLGATA